MKRNQSGQVALVLVLIMTVVSGLAVSLASRSTTNTNIQELDTESTKALLTAQTGLEKLIINQGENFLTESLDANTSFEATRAEEGSEKYEIGKLSVGSTIDISLSGADFGKLLGVRINWSADNNGGDPGLLVSVFRSDGSVTSSAYDSLGENGFVNASSADIAVDSSVERIRIMAVSSSPIVEVVPLGADAVLPSQIFANRSVGTVKSADKNVKMGLLYEESKNDMIPSVFDYVLFSGGSIVQ